MSQKRKRNWRVNGPYEELHHGKIRYRVAITNPAGKRRNLFFETRDDAEEGIAAAKRDFAGERLLIDLLGLYWQRLQERVALNEIRLISAESAMSRLKVFLPLDLPASEFTKAKAQKRYAEFLRGKAVASCHAYLTEAKAFFKWALGNKLIPFDPVADLRRRGKPRKGRPTLTADEAKKWLAKALELGERYQGPIAASMCLLMGLRSSEALNRQVRDLDRDGTVLWIPTTKTENGRRTLKVPDIIRSYLWRLAYGKQPEDKLFDIRTRQGVWRWTVKICDLIGVPRRCVHSMRALHSSLAQIQGVTIDAVAKALGDTTRITRDHYTNQDVESERTGSFADWLIGGTIDIESVPPDNEPIVKPREYLPN